MWRFAISMVNSFGRAQKRQEGTAHSPSTWPFWHDVFGPCLYDFFSGFGLLFSRAVERPLKQSTCGDHLATARSSFTEPRKLGCVALLLWKHRPFPSVSTSSLTRFSPTHPRPTVLQRSGEAEGSLKSAFATEVALTFEITVTVTVGVMTVGYDTDGADEDNKDDTTTSATVGGPRQVF